MSFTYQRRYRGKIQAVTERRPRRRQDIRHVDAANQGRFDRLPGAFPDEIEAQSVKA